MIQETFALFNMKKRNLSSIITLCFLIDNHYLQRKTIETIAENLGCTAQAIFYHGKKLHFKFLKDELKVGLTLCLNCHKNTDNYGHKARELIQKH